MELNDKNEPCTVNIPNKKIPDQKLNFDGEEDDVDIDEDDGQIQMANICFLAGNLLCDKGEDEWLIDEDSDDSLDYDLGFSTSKKYKEDKNTNSKSSKIVTQKLKNSTIGFKINESTSNVKKTKEKSDLSSPKIIKHLQDLTNSTLNELYCPPRSKIIPGSSCSTSIPSPSCSTNIPDPSPSTILPGSSCSTRISDPSCLTSIPCPLGSINLPVPLSSTNLPGPISSTSIPNPSSSTNIPDPSPSTCLPGSSCSSSIPCPLDSINLPVPSSSTNLPGPTSSTSIPNPSSSTNIPDPSPSTCLPGSSCSSSVPCPLDSINLPVPSSSTNLPGPTSSTSIPNPSSSTNIPDPSPSTCLPGSSCSSSIPCPLGSINLPIPSSSTNLPGPTSSTSIPNPSSSTNIPDPSPSTCLPGLSCSSSIPCPLGSINLPVSSSSINLPGPMNSTSIPGPSSSTSIPGPSSSTSIPGPSCSTSLSGPPYVFSSHTFPSLIDDEDSNDINLSQEQQVLLLSRFYNKIFLNDCGKQENNELNQDIEISKLEDCDYVKHYISENTSLLDTDVEPEIESTEYFVEDPDIVNPDIMYNIDLNEYYNELDLLALKILKTPDDPTGLIEYKQLPPIPQIEQTHRKFTANERFRFANGISEWEYQIDRDDWNKIMVKRSVVFTAHAGFSIANEESLYVLADVAIDYVKKLAVIMKKNFDIQAASPYPDSIDPIDNSLQEIGVKGGVRELIDHYENDVFGRRNKLLKKCEHLKKIINQQIVDILKPQDVNPEDFEEEYSTNEVEENVLSNEMDSTTEEEKTEIESGIEEVIIETQYSSDENIFTDTEIKQIDPLYVDSTDIELKMNTGPKNIKNIKINVKDIKDRKVNCSRIPDSDNLTECNLLKPLVDLSEYTEYGHSGEKKKLTECKYSCASESDPDPPKSEKSLDLGTPKKVMKYLYSPIEVSPPVQLDVPIEDENDLGLDRIEDQLDEDFENYETLLTDDNVQTIYVHTMSDIDEAMSLNDDNADNYVDNTVQIIPVVSENDDSDSNIDYDIVSVNSFI